MIDELPAPGEQVQELDRHVKLLADYDECRRSIEFWKGELEKKKAQLAEIMGDATVGTVNGEQVLTYRYEERFRGADFAKSYPDTYKLFTREVTKETFDLTLFRASRPELYEEFRARSMKSSFEVK